MSEKHWTHTCTARPLNEQIITLSTAHCPQCGKPSPAPPASQDSGESATAPTLTDEQVRERFEIWAASENMSLDAVAGYYESDYTHHAWKAWKAAIREAIGRGERG